MNRTDSSIVGRLAVLLLMLIGSVPVAGVITLLTLPLWRFVESSFGLESVGHSGPDDWCYGLVYLLLASISVAFATSRGRPAEER